MPPSAPCFRSPVRSESTRIIPSPGTTVAEKSADSSTLAVVFSAISLPGTLFTTSGSFPGCPKTHPLKLTCVLP
jgi:hypothetical protein